MIGCDFCYRDKIPVGVLGATGNVGQRFVQLLSSHPWFEVKALAASETSFGKRYGAFVSGQLVNQLPAEICNMTLQKCTADLPCSILFSGLRSTIAGSIETNFAQKGYVVISNSSAHRLDDTVPLIIPEVNSDHLELLNTQTFSSGKLVTNPNCCVIGLAMALKPLDEAFGISAVHVVTLQAISGAGFETRQHLDIEDNVIPYIQGEEEKFETELRKTLGRYESGRIRTKTFPLSAQCNRVPVSDGHMLRVSVQLQHKADKEQVKQVWRNFQSEAQTLQLPSAPKRPVHYFEEASYPQTKLHRNIERGMAISVGRLQPCALFDYGFASLVHNTLRGAAGCAILIAELMTKKGLIYW